MPLTRRRFLATSAAALAPAFVPGRAFGANDRVTLGFIGIGKQGEYHLRHLAGHFSDVQVLAVCDVYRQFRELGVQIVNSAYAQKQASGQYKGCDGYNDFRDLLARADIDAVLIATPDHWHAIPVIQAAAAGKDIFCEKPLSLTIHEGVKMVEAVRRYDRVFQTGSMQRSYGNFRHACELVRNGYIGEVQSVHVSIGGPSVPCDLPAEPTPDGLDWDLWLGPAPVRPFHSELRPPHNNNFPNWRSYIDYSGGGMTDWGAHHFDIAQWGLGMDGSGPVEVNPPDGSTYETLTYRYANGVVMYHNKARGVSANGVLFTGSEGTVEVNRGYLKTNPANLATLTLKPDDLRLHNSSDHHRDWLNAIRSRRRPICDVEVGASTINVCLLGNIAYWLKRPLKWDPKAIRFVGDDEANRMLDRARREPWTL